MKSWPIAFRRSRLPVGADEIDAVAVAGIEAALESPAMVQGLEHPIAKSNDRQNRDQRCSIGKAPALGTFVVLSACQPPYGGRLDFV
jgi:hypothetical protein